MRIEWATLCRAIRNTDHGIELVAPLQNAAIAVSGFPFPTAVKVAAIVKFHYEELGTQTVHRLRGRILDPNLNPIADELAREFGLYAPDLDHPPGWEGQGIEPMLIRFVAEAEGTHTVEVRLDDQPPFTLPLLIKTLPPM